jgi:hypothetical protein
MEKEVFRMANKMLKNASDLVNKNSLKAAQINYEGMTPEAKAFFLKKNAEIQALFKKIDVRGGDNSHTTKRIAELQAELQAFINKR